jgi:hypothetical protein
LAVFGANKLGVVAGKIPDSAFVYRPECTEIPNEVGSAFTRRPKVDLFFYQPVVYAGQVQAAAQGVLTEKQYRQTP